MSGQMICEPAQQTSEPSVRLVTDGAGGSKHTGDDLELLMAARKRPGPERDRLVDAFMPLIGSVARTYRGSTAVDRSELLQEGVVGLLRALERYDPSFGTPFWAYASWWVRQAMQQLVAELTRPVVLSDRALRQLARVKAAQRRFVQENGREPAGEELASEAELTREQVANLFAVDRRPRAFEEPVGGDHEVSATFGELIADPCGEDPFELVQLRPPIADLARLMGDLTARERMVLRARYGLDGDELTLRELGERLGVSAERVRQIEHGALDKLRWALGFESGAPAA